LRSGKRVWSAYIKALIPVTRKEALRGDLSGREEKSGGGKGQQFLSGFLVERKARVSVGDFQIEPPSMSNQPTGHMQQGKRRAFKRVFHQEEGRLCRFPVGDDRLVSPVAQIGEHGLPFVAFVALAFLQPDQLLGFFGNKGLSRPMFPGRIVRPAGPHQNLYPAPLQ